MEDVPKKRVALVVPAWNEAGCIGAVLSEVPPEAVDCVFVVCGSSTDATAEIAAANGARAITDVGPGYGRACLAGARAAAEAGAEIIVFLDGDYSDPPGEIPRIVAPLLDSSAEVVLGWRTLLHSPDALPQHARLGNRLVLAALHLLVGRDLHDLPSFKAIQLGALERLEMEEMTYGWTTELVVKAIRARLRIVELPVEYRPRKAGKSKVSGTFRGTLGAAWKLCSCAFKYSAWSPSRSADNGTRGNVVYVIAKAPAVGASKTRLCPPLEPRQAALLAEAFLRDTLATVRQAGCVARVMCRAGDDRSALERLLEGTAKVWTQDDVGLGDALRTAFREGLAEGFDAVAVLGADSPTLPASAIEEAFAALRDGADVAIGPSEDGGYYLLAARALHVHLFADLPWSTDVVARLTLERCQQAGLRTHVLPSWYDVDDATTLARLRGELASTPDEVAVWTSKALGARRTDDRPTVRAGRSMPTGTVP